MKYFFIGSNSTCIHKLRASPLRLTWNQPLGSPRTASLCWSRCYFGKRHMNLSSLNVSTGWHEAPHTEWQQTSSPRREPQLAEQSSVLVEEMVAILHKLHFTPPGPGGMEEVGAGSARLFWPWGVLLCGWCSSEALQRFFNPTFKRGLWAWLAS